MKKFYINQKVFTIGNKYGVYNEQNQVAYNVHQKLFRLGRQFEIFNSNDQLVANIEGKILKFLPEFTLYINGQETATIKKRFSPIFAKYDIISRLGDFVVEGSFFSWNFEILRNGIRLCKVSKNFNLFRDKYEIEIEDKVDEILAISMVIIIDAIHHQNKGQ